MNFFINGFWKGFGSLVTAKAPGKLYIAGEYAVVETGFPAILVALNQFVTVTIDAAEQFGSIISHQYQENSLFWRRDGYELVFDNRDNPFHYILSAIRLTEKYARECGKPLGLYNLEVNSDLDSIDGKKYGLGSSAAVTVATVKALNEYYQLDMGPEHVYKLAAIAHLDVQGNGSLGDIAASVYGGWLAYQSFDKEWLTSARRRHSLIELLQIPWPQLKIELLEVPADLRLMIGWTGSPASTSRLVDKIADAKSERWGEYSRFLDGSRQVLERMIAAFRAGDIMGIQDGLRANRILLASLADMSGVQIETPVLTKLRTLAEQSGGAAKSSGAGGGDCGIVLIDRNIDTANLLAQWAAAKIERLPLRVHEVSASEFRAVK